MACGHCEVEFIINDKWEKMKRGDYEEFDKLE
jgi:hypothetical protein